MRSENNNDDDDDDEFIFILPNHQRNRPSSKASRENIRIRFYKNKKNQDNYMLLIYIGKELAEKVNLSNFDKISVGYKKSNPRELLLKKSNIGYSVTKISSKNSPAYRLILAWTIFTPNCNDLFIKKVPHTITRDGIIINL